MTLCWSLDKLGPMTRTVEDAMLVLQAITGPDPGDVASVPSHLDFDASAKISGLRVGCFPQWLDQNPATQVDRDAIDVVRKVGMTPVDVSIPDWPYDSLNLILFAEGAAAFEELTSAATRINSERRSRTPGRTFSAKPVSSPPLILFKPIVFAVKLRRKWSGCFPRSICCWFLRYAMKC